MNPFTDLQPRRDPQPRRPRPAWLQFLAQPAPLLFAACLGVGLAVVAWRAYVHYHTAHAFARAEVEARAAALEAQLNQAPAAAEALGALSRQSRGGLSDFQRVAKELLLRYPALTSLELQPAGVVSDIVPRDGNERGIGFSVLSDPGQGPGAKEAIAGRVLTVSGPVRLYNGQQGLVARVPVFQRGADGREAFWGFVAASMRFQNALAWTQVHQLPDSGYGFAFYCPATARQKGLMIASRWLASLQRVESQEVRVQGLKFCLVVKPRAGWVNKAEVAWESLVVVLIAGLAACLACALTERRAQGAELAHVTQQLAQEQTNRSKAEVAHNETKGRLATTQAELEQAQQALAEANTRVTQLEAQLETRARERDETVHTQEAKLKEVQGALAKAQEKMAELQIQLETTAQTEKQAAAAATEREREHQTVVAELRAKLDAATRSAREAAKASAAELARREQSHRELQERLARAEQAEARVKELKAQLRKAQEELKERPVAAPQEEAAAPAVPEVSIGEVVAEPPAPAAEVPEAEVHAEAPAPEVEVLAESTEELPAATPEPVTPTSAEEALVAEAEALAAELAEATTPPEEPAEIEPPAEPVVSPEPASSPAQCTEESAPIPEPATPTSAEEPLVAEVEARAVEVSEARAVPEEPAKAEPASEPAASPKPASKPPRRRRSSRDDQMDLFGGGRPAGETDSKAPAKAAEPAREPKAPQKAEKSAPAARLPTPPPVDAAELRTAVHQILPLLVDQDPGAKDCLRDNRNTFRSAFTPEGFVEFEQQVKHGDSAPALENLKKAARRHGIPV